VLCARSGQIAAAARQRAEALASSFEAPLKEAARTVKSVQAAVADRSAALSQFAQVYQHHLLHVEAGHSWLNLLEVVHMVVLSFLPVSPAHNACLSDAVQAKSDLESRKVKLAKLRGTPGLKVWRVPATSVLTITNV
jgi:hypothetical protein